MRKKSRNIENHNPFNHPFFDENDQDADKLLELWGDCKDADKPAIVNSEETELALSAIYTRLEKSKTVITPLQSKKATSPLWLYLAAALVVISVGYFWLSAPQKISIPYGETATIQLPDGSRVSLNSGSTLTRNKFFGITNRKLTLDGEAFFTVEKNETPFIVHANDAVIQVTGTAFNVRSWSDEPENSSVVSVQSGQVWFYANQNPDARVTLNPGESSKLNPDEFIPVKPIRFNKDQVLAWRNDNLSFNNQTLRTIFRQLERTFDVNITFDNQEIADSYLTTYYSRPDNLEMVLNDICTVKGLTYARTANGYKIQLN